MSLDNTQSSTELPSHHDSEVPQLSDEIEVISAAPPKASVTGIMEVGQVSAGKAYASGQKDSPAVEESMEARIERLGRARPEVFDSLWSEIVFVFSISMSQVLTVSPSITHLLILIG